MDFCAFTFTVGSKDAETSTFVHKCGRASPPVWFQSGRWPSFGPKKMVCAFHFSHDVDHLSQKRSCATWIQLVWRGSKKVGRASLLPSLPSLWSLTISKLHTLRRGSWKIRYRDPTQLFSFSSIICDQLLWHQCRSLQPHLVDASALLPPLKMDRGTLAEYE